MSFGYRPSVALCCICPDAKQRMHLDLVRSSWEHYAARHALPIHIIHNPPVPEHFFWGKYFLFDLPELAPYDALLVLDNDILINPLAPDVVSAWNPELVGMVDESAQFGWDEEYVRRYYAHYDLVVPSTILKPLVLNGGVLLYARQHSAFFRAVYQEWLQWQSNGGPARTWAKQFQYANDQSHMGLALQRDSLAQNLDVKFNRLWWSAWREFGKRSELPFKIYTKLTKILTRGVSPAIARPLAQPGLREIARVLESCHFLHFAGSKSPLHLLVHR